MYARVDLRQCDLQPRVPGGERPPVQGRHGGSVGPQDPVLDVVEGVGVAADTVAHRAKEPKNNIKKK